MLQMGAHASLSVVKGCCPGKDVRYHSARISRSALAAYLIATIDVKHS